MKRWLTPALSAVLILSGVAFQSRPTGAGASPKTVKQGHHGAGERAIARDDP
jgi:hypothetical protein